MRISLLKPVSSASPSARTPWPVKSEHLPFPFPPFRGLPEHSCIAMNVCQQLLTAPSFAHGRSVPPDFIFLVLLPLLQCSRRCAWHFVARDFVVFFFNVAAFSLELASCCHWCQKYGSKWAVAALKAVQPARGWATDLGHSSGRRPWQQVGATLGFQESSSSKDGIGIFRC